jgi:hypothetical protein
VPTHSTPLRVAVPVQVFMAKAWRLQQGRSTIPAYPPA